MKRFCINALCVMMAASMLLFGCKSKENKDGEDVKAEETANAVNPNGPKLSFDCDLPTYICGCHVDIENMKDKGYSYEDILNFINLCETETDREFLDDLMNKDYEAAFQINPYDLSDNMFVIVTDYSVHMLHFDSNNRYDFRGENPVDLNNMTDFDELEAFSNAILASTNQPLGLNGNTISLTYRDIYLENITGCAGRMTQIQAGAVALMNPGDVCCS